MAWQHWLHHFQGLISPWGSAPVLTAGKGLVLGHSGTRTPRPPSWALLNMSWMDMNKWGNYISVSFFTHSYSLQHLCSSLMVLEISFNVSSPLFSPIPPPTLKSISLSLSPFYYKQHWSLHIAEFLQMSAAQHRQRCKAHYQALLWAHLKRMELDKIIYNVYIWMQIAHSTFTQI